MLYDKSTLFVHDTYVIENNPSMANLWFSLFCLQQVFCN
jgi:hypothetical protein